jgi:hypothetical protein
MVNDNTLCVPTINNNKTITNNNNSIVETEKTILTDLKMIANQMIATSTTYTSPINSACFASSPIASRQTFSNELINQLENSLTDKKEVLKVNRIIENAIHWSLVNGIIKIINEE